MTRFTGHAPFLVVPDVATTLDHYRDVLGFEVATYEHDPEENGTATRDDCTIFFNRGPEAKPNSELVPPDLFDVYVWVEDVDSLHAELQGHGAELLHGPVERPWGMREIRVRDPNGYVLGFGEPLGS